MAPIKFEDNIREQLQERELQPSKDAWKKLSSKLNQEMPEKKAPTFLWMAVAASFVGLLWISTLWFSSKNEFSPMVVEPVEEKVESKILTPQQKTTPLVEGQTTEENTINEKEVDVVPNATTRGLSSLKETQKVVDKVNSNTNKPIQRTDNNAHPMQKEGVAAENTELIPVTSDPLKISSDLFFNQKIDEVVAEVKHIQQQNNSVTPDEIEALLAKAQRDISTQRILKASNQKVDAAALLLDVETEMERSFREKVFQALGEGFNVVRTAVVERNQ